MARYKLRVPEAGDWLYGDGDDAVVADTREQARESFEEERGEPAPYLHSYIGRCRVVYKRDVENGDAHEDAEPGDTTVDYCRDDDRELAWSECRVWVLGPPTLAHWEMKPILDEPVTADEIPVGVGVHHRRLGSGRTVGPGYVVGLWWYLPVEFGWPRFDTGVVRNCKVACVSVNRWRNPRYRLTINGEHIADGSQRMLSVLADLRQTRLAAEWEAEQDREREAAAA